MTTFETIALTVVATIYVMQIAPLIRKVVQYHCEDPNWPGMVLAILCIVFWPIAAVVMVIWSFFRKKETKS